MGIDSPLVRRGKRRTGEYRFATDPDSRRAVDARDYIRGYYKVDVDFGSRVVYDGTPGTVAGFTAAYLVFRADGADVSVPIHPTWRVDYGNGEVAS